MKDEEIKISVIIPIYNKEKYLDACVSSVCKQTYKNLEIILIDDGSSAPCREMCDDYALKDSRVVVVHKENGGLLSARRKGIEVATGDYVATIDADDWIELDFYYRMAEMIIENKPDMITASNYYRNYEDGHYMEVLDNRRRGYWERSEFAQEILPYFIKENVFFETEFPISMAFYMFETNFARKNMQRVDQRLKLAADYTFVMLAFLNARSFAVIPYRGYHYRCHTSSMTHTVKNLKESLQMVHDVLDKAISQSDYDQSSLRRKNNFVMYHSFLNSDYKAIYNVSQDFLFPYSKVKRGSRIVIYGAGLRGKAIYDVVKDSTDYNVAGIVDKNWRSYSGQEFDVTAPETIPSLTYDYIVIAVAYTNIIDQIKRYLIEKLGVDPERIAEIDLSALDEAHLPFRIKENVED